MSTKRRRLANVASVVLAGIALLAGFKGYRVLAFGALYAMVCISGLSIVLGYLDDRREFDVWRLFSVVGPLNFLAFWIIGVYIGGSAWFGLIEDGRYFVGDHGRLTEVSRPTYWYSWIHSWSQAVTFPLGIVGGFIAGPPDTRSPGKHRAA